MSIHELLEKIKPWYVWIICIVVCTIVVALGLIFIREQSRPAVSISQVGVSDKNNETTNVISAVRNLTQAISTSSGEVIGSKNGTLYYFPWCSGAKRIKPENQVVFTSIDLAKQAGYTPSKSCKGLQ